MKRKNYKNAKTSNLNSLGNQGKYTIVRCIFNLREPLNFILLSYARKCNYWIIKSTCVIYYVHNTNKCSGTEQYFIIQSQVWNVIDELLYNFYLSNYQLIKWYQLLMSIIL